MWDRNHERRGFELSADPPVAEFEKKKRERKRERGKKREREREKEREKKEKSTISESYVSEEVLSSQVHSLSDIRWLIQTG